MIETRGSRRQTQAWRVGVVVVYHSGLNELRECLASLPRPLIEEVVVVNNSEARRTAPSRVTDFDASYVSAGRNLGFGGGANFGVAHLSSAANAVLVLNPDVRVTSECLAQLLRHLDDSAVGLVAPRLIGTDGAPQASARRFPSPLTDLCRRTPAGRTPFGRRLLDSYLLPSKQSAAAAVDWVVGACMMVRRSAGDEVGWFDPRFFLYFEDVDLCARVWSAGWKVMFEPAAVASHVHVRQSAGPLKLSAAQRHHITSAFRFYLKHPGMAWSR